MERSGPVRLWVGVLFMTLLENLLEGKNLKQEISRVRGSLTVSRKSVLFCFPDYDTLKRRKFVNYLKVKVIIPPYPKSAWEVTCYV